MSECNSTPKKRKNESVASFRKRKSEHKKLTDELTNIVFGVILSADYSRSRHREVTLADDGETLIYPK